MAGKWLSVCGLALVLALPGRALAGEVHLLIKDGRVALATRDATLREILNEWEKVGGTRIVNRDRVPGTPLTIELIDVPETQALATLLRPIAGYLATRRLGPEGGASEFSRIILMPGEAAPLTGTAQASTQPTGPPGMGMGGPPSGRPGMQRRVLPDGRVVTMMDDSQRADQDDADEPPQPPGTSPGLSRPPFPVPQRMQQGQEADEAPGPYQQQPGQAVPGTVVTPVVPATTAMPGAVMPTKPPGPTPPKPPGI
jgi:hypothetical protein